MASKIAWGTGYENDLLIDIPFDAIGDREAREGSEWAQGASGVEDAWITGRDYVLDLESRWIPYGVESGKTTLSGPVSWQHFLDHARDKNTFRFVPDVSYPDFYVDGCYLVDPVRGFGTLSSDLKRNVRFKIRNPTVDFMQALRGIMFEYLPGGSLTDPLVATYSRASTAAYRNKSGIGVVEATGTLRDRHWIGATRTTVLERGATNRHTNPENFGAWTVIGTPVLTAGQADPFGGTAGYIIEDDDAGVAEGIYEAVTFGTDGTKTISLFVKAGTATASVLQLLDNTAAASRLSVLITWTAGVPSLSVLSGGGTLYAVQAYANGWYRILASVNSVVAANVNRVRIFACDTTLVANVGTVLIYGAMTEDAPVPTTFRSTVARAADALSFPFPYVQQAMWIYLSYIELGTGLAINTTGSPRLLQIGKSDNTLARVLIANSSGGTGTRGQWFNAAGSNRNSDQSVRPALYDLVEVLVLLYADGSVKTIQAINGGAEVSATQSAALAFDVGAGWGDSLIWLNSVGTTAPGVVGVRRAVVGVGTAVSSIALARVA